MFFGRFLDARSQKSKLSELSLKKIFRKFYQKCVGLIINISCLRSWKLSKNKLGGILEIFCDYLTAIKSFFSFCGMRVTRNFHLG